MGLAQTGGPGRRTSGRACGFCGQLIPVSVDSVHRPGTTPLGFCSDACASAYSNGDEPFGVADSFRRLETGVGPLDTLLPWGMPANSMVLLVGEEGMRHRGLQTELAWRALLRDEPVVFVSFLDTPIAIVEAFRAFGWNVLPFLESGDVHVVDCFTNRLRKEHRTPENQVEWNDHVGTFLTDAVTKVREPDDLREVETKVHDVLGSKDVVDEGIVLVDSLNEATTAGREFRTEQFVAEIRADVCKRLFVPMFVCTTVTEEATIARDHGYLFDGIVDQRLNEGLAPNGRLKQLSIRKMDGVRYLPYWVAYEALGNRGFRVFDPETQLDAVYGHSNRTTRSGRGRPSATGG